MRRQESTIKGHDGLALFCQAWLPDADLKAVLILVHGLAEHSGRYGNLVQYFVPRGYGIRAMDLRGHGRSPGSRGYVRRFRDYVDDTMAFLIRTRAEHPETPLFLLGHSMGGTIAIACALEDPHGISGLVLSATVLTPGRSISRLHILAAGLLSRLAPRLKVTRLDSAGTSRDPAVVRAYEADPLVYRGRISARLGGEFLAAMHRGQRMIPRIRLPLLIMHGADDRLSNPEGSRLLHERAGSEDKTLILYDGLYHELFNEPERERVFGDMERWLEAHISPGSG